MGHGLFFFFYTNSFYHFANSILLCILFICMALKISKTIFYKNILSVSTTFEKNQQKDNTVSHILVKTGPFHEHSNQLWNISGVQLWTKVYTGLSLCCTKTRGMNVYDSVSFFCRGGVGFLSGPQPPLSKKLGFFRLFEKGGGGESDTF